MNAATPAPDAFADARGPCHLVVLRHVVVAQDIAMTLREADEGARVILARTAEEALGALGGVGAVAAAFVAQGPRRFAGSALALALAARGARVVLIGEEAEAEGEALGYAVLARPFTSDGVLARLRG